MDIAQLGYSVDSSGLERGTRALDDNTRAAERTSAATETLETRYQAIARRGIEYAESTRGANLSDRALAESAREAAAGIDTKAQIMARAGSEQERMARRVRTLQEAEARAGAQTEKAARAHALQELNLKKLLGQIDPTIARLDRLAEMEGTLEKAIDVGAISPEIFTQYQAKIDATRAATLNAGKASDIMTASIGGLNLQAVETQQSIAALGRSLVTGQWGQAQASITSLAARTGVMSGIFTAAGLAVGAAGASVGAYVFALNAAEKDTSRITNALLMTGNYAGVTSGQIDQLVDSFASLDGVTRGGARDALIRVAESGRIAGEQFEMVAAIAARMEAATGQSLDTTISKFEEIGRDPVAALLKLNETEHFLTQAHLDRIDALIAEGDEQGVAAESARIYAGRLDEVASAAAAARPHLSSMLSEIRQIGSATLEGAKNFAEFLAAASKLNSQRSGWQRFGPLGAVNFVRDMYSAEPASAPGVSPVAGVIDSRHESERRAAAEAAERDIQRQMEAVYGLDTAINRLEVSFGSMSEQRQKALVADGTYTKLLNRAMEEDAKRAESARKAAQRADSQMQKPGDAIAERLRRQIALNEEQSTSTERLTATERLLVQVRGELERSGDKTTAAQRRMIQSLIEQAEASDRAAKEQKLLQQYQASEASLTRQIALHGRVGRAAAMAFDTAHGALASFSTAQKSALMEMAEWLDWLDEMAALDDVWNGISEGYKKTTEPMSEYARQAARNMQSHFATYLFDPFAEGSRGMLKGFSDTVRRMMAEAASSKFFEMIGGAMSAYSGSGSGWINAIGGVFQDNGKREYGGPVSRSGMYQVGERNKPEILSTPNGQYLIPGDSGRVDPIRAAPAPRGSAMTTPQININLHGAPEGTTASARANGSGGFDLEVMMGQIRRDIAGDVAGGGVVASAIKGRFDTKERI